ncbi:Golgi apparatus membrane protein tvp18 [Entomophthora muscae]|uniref:Golgi apparatus membrane protein tvp18 n=1 Tax=Entomophthora muscae TaxID=34485 RepID=A0ACC2RUH3_9FUNG|nr:Golgi apparatus membrane protein tvp18 [Entomophthora muscae]
MFDPKAEALALQPVYYAQWLALVSCYLFFILGVFYIPGSLAGFSICGLFFAVYIILFEAPLFLDWIPRGPRHETFLDVYNSHFFRCGVYMCFSLVMYLSCIISASGFIAPAITLMLASINYGVAGALNHSRRVTGLLGGQLM